MKMDPIIYICAVAAVMLPVVRWLPLMFFSINHAAFDAQIQKLLEAGNYDRALKLCKAVPSAFYVAMIRAVLEGGKKCKPSDGEALITETMRDAFQREYSVQMKRAKMLGFLAPAGALIAAAGLFMAGNDPAEPAVVYAPAVIAVMLWISSLRKVQKLRDKSMRGLELILPLAAAHIAKAEEQS